MTLPIVFSLIFFTAFALYFFIGIYVLYLNFRSELHRVFFASCMSLCFWAFSFSIANSAPDYETCLFWRRAACLGWGTYFSILLHFMIILTGNKQLLKNKLAYLPLYFPAAVNLFTFCFYGEIAVRQYHLFNTYAGWVNISEGTVWDVWYNFYYIIFSAASILLVLLWGIRAADRLIRKQSIVMGAALTSAILAGTLTEFVINAVSPVPSLQVAPVVALLPMLLMLFCIKKYQLLPPAKDDHAEAGKILSDATRTTLYRYLMLVYVFGGFLSFAAQYFRRHESLNSALLFSIAVILMGFALQAIQNIKIGTVFRDVVSDLLMAATIPVMAFRFIERSEIYSLIVPVAFLLVSVAFDQKRMLYLTGAVTTATLLLLWLVTPIRIAGFTPADHIIVILLFLASLRIAFLINRIYRRRLVQYEDQVKQQELLAEISGDFVSADEENIYKKISGLLQKCGAYFNAEHAYLVFYDNIKKEFDLLCEWRDIGVISISGLIEDAEKSELPAWLDETRFTHGGNVLITKAEELADGSRGMELIAGQQTKSILTMQLMEKDKVFGFLVFHASDDGKLLEDGTPGIVRLIGNHLTHSLLRVAAERELNHMAYFDNLTGIPNRTLFNKRLENAIKAAAETGSLVGLIYLDLDLFKTVNDIMGHDVGDEFLKQVAENLTYCLNDKDNLARFGGDEFLILIPQASNLGEIKEAAENIMEMFNKPVSAGSHEFSVTASMGISVFPADGNNPEELVKNADLAMYCSKEYGKNQYTVCSEKLKKDFRLKTELTNSLYHVLDRDELELYYQPKVNVDGEITGAEALIRWNHPTLGMIMPDEFIPIAESIGLVSDIDQWVVRKACWQTKAWQDQGYTKIKVAFNLSPAQFYRESFISSVRKALKENKLDPESLEVEITESIAYYRPELFMKIVNKLKAMGLSVAIDDFGSDYSSLGRLRSLPIDRIKIDRQFTDELPFNKKQGDIVKAILALGSILGLKVTVEGVENECQYEFFKENICDEIQGYYFYRPMPVKDMESVLKR